MVEQILHTNLNVLIIHSAVVGVTVKIVWYVTFVNFQVVEALSIMTKWGLQV